MGIGETFGNRIPGVRQMSRRRMMGRLVNTALAKPGVPAGTLADTVTNSIITPAHVREVIVRPIMPIARDRYLDRTLAGAEASSYAKAIEQAALEEDQLRSVKGVESPLFFSSISDGGAGLLSAIDKAKQARALETGIPPEQQAFVGIIEDKVAAHNIDHISLSGMRDGGLFRTTDVQPHGGQMSQWVGYDVNRPLN